MGSCASDVSAEGAGVGRFGPAVPLPCAAGETCAVSWGTIMAESRLQRAIYLAVLGVSP